MLWETSQQLTSLPPLSPDARRFVAAFLNADQDVNELAAHLNEDFFDVIRRLCDPPIKAWIAAINALKGNERRERALRALDAALTEETNPSAIRRAASRILRHLELTRPRDAKAPAVEVAAKNDASDASRRNSYDPPCPPTPPPPHPHRPKQPAAPHRNQTRSPRNPPPPPSPPSASPASSSSPSKANSSPSPRSPSSSARAP